MSRAIILTDGKAGHENQSRAFARALGCDAEIVPVAFRSRTAKMLSYLLDRAGIRTLALFAATKPGRPATVRPLHPEWLAKETAPDVVIGTGSGTFYAAKALAGKLGAKCGVVLTPSGYSLSSFDCILSPSFDNPPRLANIITIPVNLVANDEEFYAKGVEAFREHYKAAKAAAAGAAGTGAPAAAAEPGDTPAVAVIVGGPNKCSTMTPEWMKGELERIFAETPGCEHWVTTSRRTPPEVEAVVDSFPFDYKLLYSRDRFNPIPAFVKLAQRLYVTAESTGMLSEACSFGSAEVHVLDNLKPGRHKFRRFVDGLRAEGYIGGGRKANLAGAFFEARDLLGL